MVKEASWEKIRRWNNFSLPELKEILAHCTALEQLGIAQDEEMMVSIKQDIELIENNKIAQRERAIKHPKIELLITS
jgi:hypothetical protein